MSHLPSSSSLSIGALAQRAGVSTRSLRYYEEQGILVSDRTQSGHRRYAEGSERCVHFVQDLFRAGLTSSIIRELRDDWNDPAARPQVLAALNSRLSVLEGERDSLVSEIDHLGGVIAHMGGMQA